MLAAGALAAVAALLAFLSLFANRDLGADRLEAIIERRRARPRPAPSAVARPRLPEPCGRVAVA